MRCEKYAEHFEWHASTAGSAVEVTSGRLSRNRDKLLTQHIVGSLNIAIAWQVDIAPRATAVSNTVATAFRCAPTAHSVLWSCFVVMNCTVLDIQEVETDRPAPPESPLKSVQGTSA